MTASSPSNSTSSADASLPSRCVELECRNLTKSFADKVVLRNINLTIHAGELVAIVGASGSGKTVLLDTLIGLHAPSSGSVLAADHNRPTDSDGCPPMIEVNTLDDDGLDLLRLHWAVVFQRNALFSGSVRDNVGLWLSEHTSLSSFRIDEITRQSLAAVALDVGDVIDKDRESLSGGMAKRVAVARAIACDPIVIFYDEPTTGLDPVTAGTMHDLLWDVHRRPLGKGLPLSDLPRDPLSTRAGTKRTSIIVTHDRDLLRRLRPRVIMLHDARVCYDGPYESFGVELPDGSFGGGDPARAYLTFMPTLHETERR